MALGTDDVQAARCNHLLVVLVGDLPGLGKGLVIGGLVHLGRVQAALVEQVRCQTGRVAAELDVRAATGHVGGDRDGATPPGLGDDARLSLVELGIQDFVGNALPLHHLAEAFGCLDRDRADKHRATAVPHLGDLLDHRAELGIFAPIDEVGPVVPDHRPIGGNRHDFELVDLVELLRLGHRRAGHAGELVVQAEVVLEGDRGEGHRLALDAEAFLRLDGLVESLAPASTGHLATRELVDDDDLAVLDDVVAVPLVESMGPERLLEVAGQAGVGIEQVVDSEELLDLVDALFGR